MIRFARRVATVALLASVALQGTAFAATQAPAVQIVPGARIAEIDDRRAAKLAVDAAHAAVATSPPADQIVPTGRVAIVPGAEMRQSPQYVFYAATITIDGRPVRTVYAGYRIVAYTYAPVLRVARRAGYVLQRGDVDRLRVPDLGAPHAQLDELVGRKLNADSPAGMQLSLAATSVDEIVRAGSPVVLIVRDGSVSLAADVVARTSGGMGETVTVYDQRAKHVLSGIVTAPSCVTLTLPEANGT